MKAASLIEWRDSKITGELFMGLPDRWYERATWACKKGHISHRYLKSEKGSLCLCCMEPVILVPPETTERELASALCLNATGESDDEST